MVWTQELLLFQITEKLYARKLCKCFTPNHLLQFSQPYSALFCNLEVYIVHEEPAKHKRSGFLCSPGLLLSNFELFDCMDARQPQKMIQDDISPLT